MYKARFCRRCGAEYIPNAPRTRYCPACRLLARKEIAKVTSKVWRTANPDKVRANHDHCYHRHPIGSTARECSRCKKQYFPTGTTQKYCPDCARLVKREQQAIAGKAWALTHPEKIKMYETTERAHSTNARWHSEHPESDSLAARRMKAKRRVLGFNPLNSPFDGCEGHHINQSDVIYIPKEMHKSVWHNVWTGRNMDTINALAGAYLTEDWT